MHRQSTCVCVCVCMCTCFCQRVPMRIGRSNTASCVNTYKCLVSYWLPPFDKQHTVWGSHLENWNTAGISERATNALPDPHFPHSLSTGQVISFFFLSSFSKCFYSWVILSWCVFCLYIWPASHIWRTTSESTKHGALTLQRLLALVKQVRCTNLG